jgi:hypothetical protein
MVARTAYLARLVSTIYIPRRCVCCSAARAYCNRRRWRNINDAFAVMSGFYTGAILQRPAKR